MTNLSGLSNICKVIYFNLLQKTLVAWYLPPSRGPAGVGGYLLLRDKIRRVVKKTQFKINLTITWPFKGFK